jgi:hypothetical protein
LLETESEWPRDCRKRHHPVTIECLTDILDHRAWSEHVDGDVNLTQAPQDMEGMMLESGEGVRSKKKVDGDTTADRLAGHPNFGMLAEVIA